MDGAGGEGFKRALLAYFIFLRDMQRLRSTNGF